ncbi:MAG: hypothetical protein ABUL60_10880 [Myxococcales bacterium]
MFGRTKLGAGRCWLSAVSLCALLFSTLPAAAQTPPTPAQAAPMPTPVASTPGPATPTPTQATPTLSTTPPDPRLRELLARATRMQSMLGRLAKESDNPGTRALLDLALGAAYAGIGVAVALDTHEKPRDSFFRGLAVTESLAIGGTYIGKAIYGLSGGSSFEEDRYARFLRDVRAHRMTELRLAQYEAELYVEADRARNGRRLQAWANLGGALAGAGLIALAATSNMTGAAKGLTLLEGAVLTPTCAIGGIVGLARESMIEKEWRRYRTEQGTASVARLTVVPVLTPGRAVLMVGSSF